MPRFQVKQTEPLKKPCRVKSPCVGVCSTSTVSSVWCCGCNRHYLDIIRWNQYTQTEKIEAMWRAVEHRKLKAEGKVDDHSKYSYTGDNKGFNIND